MYIQPVTQQPNYKGKLVITKSKNIPAKSFINDKTLDSKFKEIATMLQDKSYDLFIFENKQNPDFYNIAANTSLRKAKKIKEYTVKIQTKVLQTSIVDATKEAMRMYEKYIARGTKG